MIICYPKAVTSGITVSNQLTGDTHVESNSAQVQVTTIAKPVRQQEYGKNLVWNGKFLVWNGRNFALWNMEKLPSIP